MANNSVRIKELAETGLPADTDVIPVDTASGTRKLGLSSLSDWFFGKLTTKVIDTLLTNNKTIVGSLNELNAKCINMNNAGFHNSVYRGKHLGDSVTDAQYAAIKAGTFDDMYIGDYWTIDDTKYRIAAFDYYLHCGNTQCQKHHVVLVPDYALYACAMNDSNTTIGAYAGSKMYTAGLDRAKTTIKEAFNGHVLSHRIYFSNEISNGKVSSGAWYDSEVDLICEHMVYGSGIFSPVSDGTAIPGNQCVEKSQLPLFQHDPTMINHNSGYWLRDVISDSNFAYVSFDGSAIYNLAGNSSGDRPFFCIA